MIIYTILSNEYRDFNKWNVLPQLCSSLSSMQSYSLSHFASMSIHLPSLHWKWLSVHPIFRNTTIWNWLWMPRFLKYAKNKLSILLLILYLHHRLSHDFHILSFVHLLDFHKFQVHRRLVFLLQINELSENTLFYVWNPYYIINLNNKKCINKNVILTSLNFQWRDQHYYDNYPRHILPNVPFEIEI